MRNFQDCDIVLNLKNNLEFKILFFYRHTHQ